MNEGNVRYNKIMEGAALWGAFYRNNPDKFVEEYLHIKLKLFQRILIVMMFWSTTFVMIACRGIGKTFISAVYVVARCILYPGTKVCIVSGTRGQAINVLEKILYELKPASAELCAEIDEKQSKVNNTNAVIVFNNTSVIKVVTASDNARGNRSHVLLLDEYRLISKDTIDTVLRKFLTLRRMPRYEELTEEEKNIEYDKEKNLTMYLSSAFFKDHWSYQKCVDTFKAMIDPARHQFVCGFPYQLSLSEGLLDAETVADEMSEADFSEIKFSMEMCAEFFGSAEGAFFDFDSISKNRRIKYPMLPDRISSKLPGCSYVRIPPKQNGEIRVLAADIALMSSKKNFNDASSIFLNQMLPSKSGRYSSNIIYADAAEGLRTDDQALEIRRMINEFQCDYLALDASGLGLGVYDCLAHEIVDPDTGEIYPALSCCNDPTMADRCTTPGAEKKIWSIKASAGLNSELAYLLREGFRSGRIRLLNNEYDAEEQFSVIKGYNSLLPAEKLMFKLPFIHTTLLINELVNLLHEENNGKVRIYEKSGARKDRYSALAYNYYVATQLEALHNKRSANSATKDVFVVKPPNQNGKAVNRNGRGKVSGWAGSIGY